MYKCSTCLGSPKQRLCSAGQATWLSSDRLTYALAELLGEDTGITYLVDKNWPITAKMLVNFWQHHPAQETLTKKSKEPVKNCPIACSH